MYIVLSLMCEEHSSKDSDTCMFVRDVLRSTLRDLLGLSGATALENFLNKRLGDDMYLVFCNSPYRFYDALKGFLGKGADAILKIVAVKLIERGSLSEISPEEFVELVKNPNKDSWKKLHTYFKAGDLDD
ncbi:MAG: hypothetical protein QXX82_05715 [Nitrososphaerota archaeon]